MAYGKIKADAIIRHNTATDADEEITMATIVTLDSNKASLTGATFTGDVILDNEQELRLMEADDGTNFVAFKAPSSLDQTSTWTMPADVPAAGQVLKVTSVANTNDPTLEWADDASGASVSAENTWTAGQRGEITNVEVSSGAITIDFDLSNNFIVIVDETIDDINYSNLTEGQSGSIFFQVSGGDFAVGGWDTATRWAGGTGGANNAPDFTATNGQCDRVDYIITRDQAAAGGNLRIQMVATLNYAD